jgi:hypothetical protein
MRRTKLPQHGQRALLIVSLRVTISFNPFQTSVVKRGACGRHYVTPPLGRACRQRLNQDLRSAMKHISPSVLVTANFRRDFLISPRPKAEAAAYRQVSKSLLHLRFLCVLLFKSVFIRG